MKKYLLLASLLLLPAMGKAQAVAAGVGGNQSLLVGGFGSYFTPDYGYQNLLGIGAYADYNVTPTLGAEAEARFLRFHQLADIHEDTYMAGPKYDFYRHGRYGVYAKGLAGIGEFNFPLNAAHGGYAAFAVGGGLDYRIHHRIYARADYEYQFWPGFTGEGPRSNGLTPNGVSAGISYRIF